MKIIHTSDWHLGKTLEGYSRIAEQIEFINELETICNNKAVDLILISGDIYDTSNPPAEAERLFYNAIKRLSLNGRRPIVIISGNHDSSNRLTASIPLASEFGVFLLGTPKSTVNNIKNEYFEVIYSSEGFFQLKVKNEVVSIVAMPYPTEKNLNEVISDSLKEEEFQVSYSDKIKQIITKNSINFSNDTINIILGHFFVSGGLETSSERKIQLGGSYSVSQDVFPVNADYVAMGHLHRYQRIKGKNENIYYSGSPIQYSKSEIGYSKCVIYADLRVGKNNIIEKINLNNYKPIEIWKVNGFEEAIKKCEESADKECWVFLEILTDEVLLQSQIKKLRMIKKDIIEILPVFNIEIDNKEDINNDKNLNEQFIEFYNKQKNTKPSIELTDLFLDIVRQVYQEEDNETTTS